MTKPRKTRKYTAREIRTAMGKHVGKNIQKWVLEDLKKSQDKKRRKK